MRSWLLGLFRVHCKLQRLTEKLVHNQVKSPHQKSRVALARSWSRGLSAVAFPLAGVSLPLSAIISDPPPRAETLGWTSVI